MSLTSTDGGEVPHVVEQFADDRAGPGVEPMAVDPQVELDPAGLKLELQWGVQGSEVHLFLVHLVSSERAGRVLFFNIFPIVFDSMLLKFIIIQKFPTVGHKSHFSSRMP